MAYTPYKAQRMQSPMAQIKKKKVGPYAISEGKYVDGVLDTSKQNKSGITKNEQKNQIESFRQKDFAWHKYNPSVPGFNKRELNKKKNAFDPYVGPQETGNIDLDQKYYIDEQKKENK